MDRIYLDHGGTTPVRQEVIEVMVKCMRENWGNPSSVHGEGRRARKALDEARDQVGALIGAKPEEVFFTGGGTEADNMAVQGVALANRQKGKHLITSSIEHHAVLDTFKFLESQGFEVTYLPVTAEGLVRVEDVREAVRDDTVLISVMHVNNEVGTIQPIKEIGQIAKDRRIFFHTDAVQSAGKIPVDVNELNVDLLTVSSHKMYGPKGVGALYVRKGTKLQPLVYGGGQERKRRPGTENMPGIVGFGKAAELARREMPTEIPRITALRNKLMAGLLNIPDVVPNGHPVQRTPYNVNVSVKYVEGESLLLNLDLAGIAASSGSACTSGSLDPSHVLLAMGLSHELAHSSLRMTLGRDNTEAEIDYVLEVLRPIIERLRSMSPLVGKEPEPCACKN
ncbi:MAG: cysteine desulfurase NifS [Bacillota bacterium]